MASNEDAVGRIYDVATTAKADYQFIYHPNGGSFDFRPQDGDHIKEVAVPGVVLRAESKYRKFDIVKRNVAVFIGDIIKTAPDTVLAMEFLIGGRVGLNKGVTVKMINEREVLTLDNGEWRRVAHKAGGVWAKFSTPDEPLTIQTNGGVLGIKG